MSREAPLLETDMAAPVISLFSKPRCTHFEQVPLGRKKIDLVFIDRSDDSAITVELKISNWKRALWQANVNFQISAESYIAIWHEYIQRPQNNLSLLHEYGVGLIVVNATSAQVVLSSKRRPQRIPMGDKPAWYLRLLDQSARAENSLCDTT
jgi:hypothetical protein